MLGVAALATLFVNYLTTFLPRHLNTWERASLMVILIAIPALANCLGVRSGANFSNMLTVAKLSPLALLVLLGVIRFAHQPQMIHASEITSPGLSNWIRAMMFLLFAFAGPEGALIPSGEIREPRRTIPFGLAVGLAACAAIYMLLQFITVATIGTRMSDTPLADTASVLLGGGGAAFVSIAIMISTYGWISGALLYAPRLAFAMAAQGDGPKFLARLHPRFHTPAVAIVLYALMAWLLASSGTFLWIVALASGAIAVYFAASCTTLIRLRKLRPNVQALRVPLGPLLSVLGVMISVAMITGLKKNDLILLGVSALIATANWLWVKRRRHPELEAGLKAPAR